jgi:hypothetical protein
MKAVRRGEAVWLGVMGHQAGNVGSFVGHLANRQHLDPADSGIPSHIYEYLPSGLSVIATQPQKYPLFSGNHSDKVMSSCLHTLSYCHWAISGPKTPSGVTILIFATISCFCPSKHLAQQGWAMLIGGWCRSEAWWFPFWRFWRGASRRSRTSHRQQKQVIIVQPTFPFPFLHS